jgi:hypothetical protein
MGIRLRRGFVQTGASGWVHRNAYILTAFAQSLEKLDPRRTVTILRLLNNIPNHFKRVAGSRV